MADEATEVRPTRGCESCGGVDDHPRTLHYLAPGDDRGVMADEIVDKLIENGISGAALRELQDPLTYFTHIDCCAQSGRCPIVTDGVSAKSCVTVLEEAGVKSEIGPNMLKKLKALKPTYSSPMVLTPTEDN